MKIFFSICLLFFSTHLNCLKYVDHYLLADKAFEAKQFSAAIAEYKQDLSERISCDAYSRIGDCYYILSLPDSAIVYYNNALDVDEDYPFAYFGLGRIDFDRQNYKSALENFQTASDCLDNFTEALFWQGKVLLAKKKYKKALLIFKQVQQIDQSYPEISHYLAACNP